MKYVSIPHGDLGGSGIDALSSEDSIQEGHAEDLVNAEASPQGYLAKRTGYQQIFGQLPMRVVRTEYNALDPATLRLMFPANVDLAYIQSNQHSRPIVVSGRTSLANPTPVTVTIDSVYNNDYQHLLVNRAGANNFFYTDGAGNDLVTGDLLSLSATTLPAATPAFIEGKLYRVTVLGVDEFYLTDPDTSIRPIMTSNGLTVFATIPALDDVLKLAGDDLPPAIGTAVRFFSTGSLPTQLNPATYGVDFKVFYVVAQRLTSAGSTFNGFRVSTTKGGPYLMIGSYTGVLTCTPLNGDFENSGIESQYYSEFKADSRKLIGATGTGEFTTEITELEHGLPSPFMWVGIAQSLDTVKLDNIQVTPAGYLSGGQTTEEGVSVSSADRTILVRQKNGTGATVKQFIYWQQKTAAPGTVYISKMPDLNFIEAKTWILPGANTYTFGSGGDAQHNLLSAEIQVKAFEIIGENYREIRPDSVLITQAGKVFIQITNNTQVYTPVFFILSTVDADKAIHDIPVPAGVKTITIDAPISPFMFASCYCDGARDPTITASVVPALELIWPDSIQYNSTTNQTVISLTTAANVSRTLHVYWEPAYLSNNILTVTSKNPINTAYIDLAPQLTVWGLDQAQAYSKNANPHAGWVSHLDTFRSPGITALVSGLGGNLFSGSELTTAEKAQYKIPTLYPSLRVLAHTLSGATTNLNLGPALVDITKISASIRDRGVLGGTGWDSGFADISSIEYSDEYYPTSSVTATVTSGGTLTCFPPLAVGTWVTVDCLGAVMPATLAAQPRYLQISSAPSSTFTVNGISFSSLPAGTSIKITPVRGVVDIKITAAQVARSSVFSIAPGMDQLQIQQCGIPIHDGSWPLLDASIYGAAPIPFASFTVVNEDIANLVNQNPELLPSTLSQRTTIWNSGQGGQCGIFSGALSGLDFLPGDVIQHSNLTNKENIVVTGVNAVGTFADNFYQNVTLEEGSLIVAARTGQVIPLRDSNEAPTAANLVTNDNLQISGFTRQFKAKGINPRASQYIKSILKPASSKVATVTLDITTGSIFPFAVGDHVLITRGEQFSGEIVIESIDTDTKSFTFTTDKTGSVGPFVNLVSGPVLFGYTTWVGETITWEDTFNSTNSVSVPGRWIPVEAPDHSNNAAPTSYTRYLSNSAYDNQPILRSTQVSDSLFLTNGDDRTSKVDGYNLTRPGLPRWQPQLFFNQATNLQSYNTEQGTIPLIKTTVNVTGWSRNYFIVAAADLLAFKQGTRIRRDGDPLTIYTVQDVQAGTTASPTNQIIVDKDITDASAADTITNVCTFSYYFRLNLVDVNDNVIASAPTGAFDCTINVTSNFQNRIKLIGLPTLDIYDYDRIEIQIYRTKQNGVAPYYLLTTLAVPFDRNEGYITWIDTVADADINVATQQDKVNVPLKGNELGTGWSPPVRSKHITSAANRLVLGNLTSDPYIDLSIRNIGSTVKSSELNTNRFLLRKSNTDTGTETDMLSRVGYFFTTNFGVPINFPFPNSGANFAISPSSGVSNLSAGDWVYLYRPDLNSITVSQAPGGAIGTSNDRISVTFSNPLSAGRPFVVSTTGVFPPSTPPLVSGTTYYVNSPEAGTFKLSTLPSTSGTVIDFTAVGQSVRASITAAMSIPAAVPATSSFPFTNHGLSANDPVVFTSATTFPVSTFTVTNTTGTASIFTTPTPHGFTQNQKVRFTGGTFPVGTPNLAPATDYYVSVLTTTTFNITATIGGAVLGFSTAGVGISVDPLFVFTASPTYYVKQVLDANSFTLSDTVGGPVHPFNTAGSVLVLTATKRANTLLFSGLTAPSDMQIGKAIRFTVTGGVLPAPLAINTTYYIVSLNGLAFSVSETRGGTAIPLTAVEIGTVSATLVGVGNMIFSTPNPSPAYAGWWQVKSQSSLGVSTIEWPGTRSLAEEPGEDQITYMIAANQTILRSATVLDPNAVPTSTLTTSSAHGLVEGQRIRLRPSGPNFASATPSIVPGQDYFATNITTNTLQVKSALNVILSFTITVTTDPMYLDIPASAKDVPVYLGTDLNYQTSNGQPSSTGAGIENLATRRWATAINATQRMTNTNISAYSTFSPWIVANAGGEYSDGQILFTQPMNQTTTFELVLSAATQYSMFVNGLERSAEEQVQAREDLHPSRILISYPNFPEIFDSPFVTTDSQSDSAIDVNPADGQEITAVIPFFGASAFGAALKDAVVVVFKSNSIYVVNLGAKAAGQVAVQKIESQGIGCTAPYSVSVVRDGIMFANESGVFKLKTDLSVYYIGRHLQNQWRTRLNKNAFSLLFGHNWAFGSQYKISVPTGTSVIPNEAYVYNSTREYTVDGNAQNAAREGSWVRHTGFNAIGWCNLNADAFQANTRGQVLQLRQTGEVFDWRDDEAPIPMELLLRSMDFGDDGVRKSVPYGMITYRNPPAQGDRFNTQVTYTTDMQDVFETADVTVLANRADTEGTSDLGGPRIITLRYSFGNKRGIRFQLRILNAGIDENVELTRIRYSVAGLNLKGILQAAQSPKTTG